MSCKSQGYLKKLILVLFFLVFFCKLNADPIIKSSIKVNSKQFPFKSSIIEKNHYDSYVEKKLVRYYINLYLKNNELSKLIKRSKPFLAHVIQELKKRNLPKELSLLPIVESEYRPLAVSKKGAIGIWQISYIAGKRYGLIYSLNNNHYDDRHDLVASTNAALNYLEFLYKRFNNDWLLALAAYNAGEGRIAKAMKEHSNLSDLDHVTSYWCLDSLPKETKHYIPKLLALLIIFENPKKFGLNIDLFNYDIIN